MIRNGKNKELISNINKIHTTKMGIKRIKNNLGLDIDDVVEYCKNIIIKEDCIMYKKGKIWYCEYDNIRITINLYTFTIITAHLIK